MFRKLLPGLAVTLFLCCAAPAFAAGGTVIWKHQGCAHFIVQTQRAYLLFEWISGGLPNDGDLLEGNLASAAGGTGTLQLQNVTADLPVTVFPVARAVQRRELQAHLPANCH